MRTSIAPEWAAREDGWRKRWMRRLRAALPRNENQRVIRAGPGQQVAPRKGRPILVLERGVRLIPLDYLPREERTLPPANSHEELVQLPAASGMPEDG
jgi:hypothetical protein